MYDFSLGRGLTMSESLWECDRCLGLYAEDDMHSSGLCQPCWDAAGPSRSLATKANLLLASAALVLVLGAITVVDILKPAVASGGCSQYEMIYEGCVDENPNLGHNRRDGG